MTQRVHERPSGQGRSLSRETREPHRASERAADADESNFSASSSLIPRFSFPLTHKKNSYAHVNKRDEKIVFINWNKSGINYKKIVQVRKNIEKKGLFHYHRYHYDQPCY